MFVIINLPAWFRMLASDEDVSFAAIASGLVLYFLLKGGKVFGNDDDDDDE